MSKRVMRGNGEIGDTVLYACQGEHTTNQLLCEPGDVHAAIVAGILSRDERGQPRRVQLAVFIPPNQPLLWVEATHAARVPGSGGVMTRLVRGAPPVEMTSDRATHTPTGELRTTFAIDFPLGSWHACSE